MAKILVRLSIPPRLRDEMMLKEASGFDVPATEAGLEFAQWWSKAPSDHRDRLMKTAHKSNISLLEALEQEQGTQEA